MEARDNSLLTRLQDLSPARRELLLRRLRRQEEGLADGGEESPVHIVPVGREGDLLPSFAQRQYWLLSRLAPDSSFYNVPGTLRMTGPLSVPALAASFREILRRHEILRTSFREVDGQPLQVIRPAVDWELPLLDLRHLPPEEREARASDLATRETTRPFDLAVAPILRVLLLRLAPEDHVLVLASHHVLFEAWSWGVLLRELSVLYGAFAAGEPSPLPELTVQYADYAAWQRQWLSGERLDSLIAFWRRTLEGFSPLALPTDRPRPRTPSLRGALDRILVPGADCAGLAPLAAAERATPFAVLLAAFLALLQRYSGQDDVVVGTPAANRAAPELEPLIGPFLNTLVIRGDLSGNPSFRELVRRTREAALDAHAHQDLPFETLVEEIRPERQPNQNPIYQVMFTFHNAPAPEVRFPGLALGSHDFETRGVRLDIILQVLEGPEGLDVTTIYNVDLFHAATVARMLARFQALVAAAARNPDTPLAELPLLSDAERRQLLLDWGPGPESPGEPRLCLTDLLARQAALTPGATVYAFEERTLTYGDLLDRSRALARVLQGAGIGPEVRVGLLLERSLAAAVGAWGTLLAGGTFVPLDPGAPRQRLAGLIEDAGILVLLGHGGQDSPVDGVRVLHVDDDGRVALDGPEAASTPPAPGNAGNAGNAANAAYVLYTSGSTGRPKGVVVEHRQVVAYLQATVRQLRLEAGVRCALLQGLVVDASMLLLFLPSVHEACVHLISEDRALDPRLYAEYANRHRIELLKIAPSHLAALLEGDGENPVASLRGLVVGGEQLRTALLRRFRERAPDCRVWNEYGPTETTVGVVVHEAGRGDEEAPAVPIGRPLAGSRALVLDPSGELTPAGLPGELCIGGPQVSRGYLGRPAETAVRFVPDPTPGAPAGARVYRTGDKVRWLADGVLEFLGRLDFQVKIRGFRVELGEIEAALLRHPAVRQAVVAPRGQTGGEAGSETLAAWVAPAGTGTTAGDLRAFLRESLPEPMVPSSFTFLESLPRTAMGKLDRRSLPEPVADEPQAESGATPPRSAVEREVAAIWKDVLGREPAGIDDNFFDLGGHSLLAFLVIAHVRKRLQVDLPPSGVFEMPTVRKLALEITRRQLAEVDPETLQRALAGLKSRPENQAGGDGR